MNSSFAVVNLLLGRSLLFTLKSSSSPLNPKPKQDHFTQLAVLLGVVREVGPDVSIFDTPTDLI